MTRWLDFDGQRLSVGEFGRLIDRAPSTVLHHLNKGRTPKWIADKAGHKNLPALLMLPKIVVGIDPIPV
jgi:hypothetical protein